MTEQEIFDEVWAFLNLQGKPSFDGACMYRSPDGSACAAGCLLDDETAKKFDTFVDTSIWSISQHHEEEMPVHLQSHVDFLDKLQEAHDSSADKPNLWLNVWREKMFCIAEEHGLAIP